MYITIRRSLWRLLACLLIFFSMTMSLHAAEFANLMDELQSEYVLIIDTEEHHVLYEKNSEEKMYPASMTKILTLMVAVEHIEHLEQTVTISEEMLEGLQEANASLAGFQVNETVTMKDLLYGIILSSGADACRVVSIALAGSEDAFVQWMNDKVKELQLRGTHFVNTTGLHDENHYTTAKDLSVILEHALAVPVCYEIMTAAAYTTSSTPVHPNGIVLHATLRTKERAARLDQTLMTGGKTGTTKEAQLCLASFREQDGIRYMMITAQAPFNKANDTAVREAHTVFQYIKDHVRYKKAAEQGTILQSIEVAYSWRNAVDVILEAPIYVFTEDAYDPADMEIIFDGNTKIEAPVAKAQRLGDIVVYYNGKEIKRIPYTASYEVKRSTLKYIGGWIKDHVHPSFYFVLVLIIAASGYAYIHKNKMFSRE